MIDTKYITELLIFILIIDISQQQRILALFPGATDEMVPIWIKQSVNMLDIAFRIWEDESHSKHHHPINYKIAYLSVVGTSAFQLKTICQIIENDSNSDIIGIIGPASSKVAILSSSWAATIGIPIISYGATGTELSNNCTYPTFFRTIYPDCLLIQAIVTLFKSYDWEKCILISEVDSYGNDATRIFISDHQDSITIVDRLSYDAYGNVFYRDLKSTLLKSRSRIVLVWANQTAATKILRNALEQNVTFSDYVWILTNEVLSISIVFTKCRVLVST